MRDQLQPELGPLSYHPAHRLLYCGICHVVVYPQSAPRHLWRSHSVRVPRAQRQHIVQQIATLLARLVRQPADLQLPSDDSPPIDFLPILSGYACRHHHGCRYLT